MKNQKQSLQIKTLQSERNVWSISPVTKIKQSKKVYSRKQKVDWGERNVY